MGALRRDGRRICTEYNLWYADDRSAAPQYVAHARRASDDSQTRKIRRTLCRKRRRYRDFSSRGKRRSDRHVENDKKGGRKMRYSAQSRYPRVRCRAVSRYLRRGDADGRFPRVRRTEIYPKRTSQIERAESNARRPQFCHRTRRRRYRR